MNIVYNVDKLLTYWPTDTAMQTELDISHAKQRLHQIRTQAWSNVILIWAAFVLSLFIC